MSDQWDLCWLSFDALPGAVPMPLFRAAQVEGIPLAAVGFKQAASEIQQHWVPELQVALEEQLRGWLQSAQLKGGARAGFSGAPVLARVEDAWCAVGMLWPGRESAATSRMIAGDAIAAFLEKEGVEVSVAELPGQNACLRIPPGNGMRPNTDRRRCSWRSMKSFPSEDEPRSCPTSQRGL